MIVIIADRVHQVIDEFYEIALSQHVTLDYETVIRKVNRLYEALRDLSVYGEIYPLARLKEEWIEAGYREFICEDFHFAYQIFEVEDGSKIVKIQDACHSLMYH